MASSTIQLKATVDVFSNVQERLMGDLRRKLIQDELDRVFCPPVEAKSMVAFPFPATGTIWPLRIAYSMEPHRMRFEPKLASQTTK